MQGSGPWPESVRRISRSSFSMPVTKLLQGPKADTQTGQALVCVALALEADIVTREFAADIGGSTVTDLADSIGQAAVAGCRGIVSFGLAGGLCPRRRAGDVIVASEIVGRTRSFATDDAWSGWLLSQMPGALYAPLAGVDFAITARKQRSELGLHSGAVAVDMESHMIAGLAAAHMLRFIAIRVVIDTLHHDIPEAALACISSGGETNARRLARLLLGRPQDTLGVLRLWGDWSPARKALVNCCETLSASVREIGL